MTWLRLGPCLPALYGSLGHAQLGRKLRLREDRGGANVANVKLVV